MQSAVGSPLHAIRCMYPAASRTPHRARRFSVCWRSLPCRARAAADARAAAKSAAVLHQRIRAGVAVGRASKPKLRISGRGRPPPQQQQEGQRQGGYMTRKERRAVQQAEAGQQGGQAGRQAPASGGKQLKRRGSRRGAAVEAQWGSTRGQYKE